MFTDEWKKYFIDIAEITSKRSKDPAMKIGAVIVDTHRNIVSTGYNGFPKNIKDSPDRLNDKDIKRSLMIHAEENAILHAKSDLHNHSIFVYGYPPCLHCSLLIIQTGIKQIFYKSSKKYKEPSEFWKLNLEKAKEVLQEAGVEIFELK